MVERCKRALDKEGIRDRNEKKRMEEIHRQVKQIDDEGKEALRTLAQEQMRAVLQKANNLPESRGAPSVAQIRQILSMDERSINVLRAARAVENGDHSAIVDMTILLKDRKLQDSQEVGEFKLESIPVLRKDATDLEGRMQYSAKPIRQSLTNLATRKLDVDARAMFKCVMGFMGDFSFPFPALQAGQIIETCRQNPALVDEALCQILKQANQSDEARSSVALSWRLKQPI